MDIKDLNKSQLLLLAVLLSFVTSIATGITTVTLMQQAPISFTTPINRIIKQTVETITPGSTTVNTVVVKEEDLVVDAIAKNKSSVFAISHEFENESGIITEGSVGVGFIAHASGMLASDALLVPGKSKYFVKNELGKFTAEFVFTEKGVSYLKIGERVGEGSPVTNWTVPTAGDMAKVKVGQKILVLGNTISSYIFDGSSDMKITVARSTSGALVLNLDGEALGIALSGDSTSFVPIKTITDTAAAHLVQ
jgi:hypothetical protein